MTNPFRGKYSLDVFMRDYWQKRPLILEGAFQESNFTVDRSNIFEIAARPEYDSRVIEQNIEEQSWELVSGPFEWEGLEDSIEGSHWTILVQDTERELDQMRQLLELFRFIPNWRLDDVQLSYAVPGGSVGPHVDSYDVFLIQLSGQRRWRIENTPITKSRAMREDTPMQLLNNFHTDQEFVAKPGDMIYLPAKIPHWGVAIEACITASIGFKAPEISMLRTAFSELAEGFGKPKRPSKYIDPVELQTDDPGRVSDAPLDWFQNEVRKLAENRQSLERIFCSAMTHPVRENWPGVAHTPPPAVGEIRQDLRNGSSYVRLVPSCIVYREFDDCIRIYTIGMESKISLKLKPFAQLLTGTEPLNYDSLKPYLKSRRVLDLIHVFLSFRVLIRVEGSNS